MEPPTSRTFGGVLREMALRFPNRPAIAFERKEMTFRELDARVDEVAKGVLSLGVRRGETIAVLAGNRPEWLVAAFAAARVGCVVVPVNTWYKDEEIAYTLRHSEARVLFTVDRLLNQDFCGMLQRIAPRVNQPTSGRIKDAELPELRYVIELGKRRLKASLSLDDLIQRGASVPQPTLDEYEEAVQPTDMVFILYTSGSTASPKAVQLHHAPAIENDFQIGEKQHLNQEDRMWLAVPLFYALAAVNAMPAAWTHGACLILQEWFDAGKALEIIERERATVFYGLGNMTRALLTHPDLPHRDLSALEKGLTGLSPEDKRLAIEDLGVTRCCSIYGSTESYGNCALTDADDPLDVKLHTQGYPLPGWEFRIVDPRDEHALDSCEVGSLLIRGYVTTGFFRTGDLAAVDEDGRLRFHSRLKEMIKVGGINVSPLEVEHLIDAHPDVQQVHVVGVPDPVKGEIVVAFVEPTKQGLDPEGIRSFVRERAAGFKVPARVLFREDSALPRVASGKVPKYKLREEAIKELGLEERV
jgi:fatty-acyl-CoA synthase